MIDFVNFYEQRIHNIVMNQFEVFVSQPVLNIPFATCEKVISHNDFVALHHQIVHQMGANESRSTCYLQKREGIGTILLDIRILNQLLVILPKFSFDFCSLERRRRGTFSQYDFPMFGFSFRASEDAVLRRATHYNWTLVHLPHR